MSKYLHGLAVFVFLLTLPLAPAAAQQQPAQQPPAPQQQAQEQPDQQAPPVAPVAPENDPAWRAYHQAYLALVDGDRAASRARLEALVREHPNHPAAAYARDALQALARLEPGAPVVADEVARPAPGSMRGHVEPPTAQARAELAIFQTIHGITAGIETCVLLDCDEPRLIAATAILGGGAGLGLSLYATRGGINPGHTLLINSGTSWGLFNGLALDFILDEGDGRTTAGLLLGGQLLGTAAGALLWDVVRPTAGDVSLANSAGIWTGVLTLMIHGATSFEASTKALWTSLLIASDVGFAAGAVLASQFPMTRGRTLIIDAGGIVGGLLGIGSMVLIQGDDITPGAVFGAGVGGTVLGLGAATWFSRDWDDDKGLSGHFFTVPTDGGMLVGYRMGF